MNKPLTLSQLADIGAKKACLEMPYILLDGKDHNYAKYRKAREIFTKAVLDAIGYKFPEDPEFKLFEDWCERSGNEPHDDWFSIWKAAREELRKEMKPEAPKEPEWIPWDGGKCPIPDTVQRWEYKTRDGGTAKVAGYKPSLYIWNHTKTLGDIIAYRVLEDSQK